LQHIGMAIKMNIPKKRALILLPLILLALSGCVGERPFMMVQLCLKDDQNVDLFKKSIRSIAQSKHMKFTDGSIENQKSLEAMKSSPNYPLIDIGAEAEDGTAMGAGNLGMSKYEVAIGFSAGSDAARSRKFAAEVIKSLQLKWKIYPVPPNRGAFPLAACRGKN
jgi:hypothetical protein